MLSDLCTCDTMEQKGVDQILKVLKQSPNRFINVVYSDLLGNKKEFSIPTNTITSSAFSSGLINFLSSVNLTDSEEEYIPVLDPNTFKTIQFDFPEQVVFSFFKDKDQNFSIFDSRAILFKTNEKLKSKNYSLSISSSIEFFLLKSSPQDPFSAGMPASNQETKNFLDQTNNILLQGYNINLKSTKIKEFGKIQSTIDFSKPLSLADNIFFFKDLVKRFAPASNLFSTFIPKAFAAIDGSSLSFYFTLSKADLNVFFDKKTSTNLSLFAQYFLAGIQKHISSIFAFSNPTTNSYKRVLSFDLTNIKIDQDINSLISFKINKEEERAVLIFNFPDSSCNPYLTISALILAGLDGVKRKIELQNSVSFPVSLREAIMALDADNAFLKPIFDQAMIDKYISLKLKEYEENEKTPTQYEFRKYI